MRTVTFSHPSIVKYVDENFVSAWGDRNPNFHNCDYGEETKIATYKGHIFATRNIATFLIYPKVGVMHYFAGYYDPSHFLQELKFGRKLYDEMKDPKKRVKVFLKHHYERMKDRQKLAKTIRKHKIQVTKDTGAWFQRMADRFPNKRETVDGNGFAFNSRSMDRFEKMSTGQLTAVLRERQQYRAAGMHHLYQTSRFLHGRVKQRKAIPSFETVRYARIGGDPFAEE